MSSNRPLLLGDDFPDPGQVEFDLGGREFLDFTPLEPAYAIDIKIGLRKGDQEAGRCLRFSGLRPQVLPNPCERLGVYVETRDRDDRPNADNEIVPVEVDGASSSALLISAHNSIKTDAPVNVIEIKLVGPEKVDVQATDGSGNMVWGKLLSSPDDPVQHHRLEGDNLHDTLISLEGNGYLLSLCMEGKDLQPLVEIPITAYAGDSEVARVVVTGLPGEIVSASLTSDIIEKVRISGGPASLLELCWLSVAQDSRVGWQPLAGVQQPITLPVLHPDYPACGNQPTNFQASLTDALARVTYGDSQIWKTPFEDIHAQCLNLVAGGPAIPMASPDRAVTYPVELEPGDTSTPPAPPRQHPLQLLLLAAMHAPIAQMLGLYWSDKTAVPGQAYDYLIVADPQGKGRREVGGVIGQIEAEGFVNLDGYIVFGKRVEAAVPLQPPVDAKVYALPGATRPDLTGALTDAACNAGLRWHLPVVDNVLLPASPVLYHLWRMDYGPDEPGSPMDADKFHALTPQDPLLVVENLFSLFGVQRPQDWPPFPLYGFDNGLAEGWYGYRVSNIDIFGRHSPLGPAARWFQWAPTPSPRPWYYSDPPGDRAVHPFAVCLLDKLPPPPPTGTEAFALDPNDPFLQRDAAYMAWFASLSAAEKEAVIGLRVRWDWTEAHMRQAPDTQEFRIYYQSGRLNTLLGQTTTVTAASATESIVQTDIPNTRAADAFTDCSLKIGPHMFTIIGSDDGSPLRLRVKNIGPLKDVRPAARVNCEVNIPNTHALFVNYGNAHVWQERTYVVDFNNHVTVGVDEAGRPLRRYEVLLPASGDTFRGGLPLHPDLAEPVKFAAIGVTAADSRSHTADDPQWATGRFASRTGNESTMSPPAIVFRVRREKPAPPVPPPDAERVYATPADYHSRSFYTYRWRPAAHLKTHIFRALDDAIFKADWSQRPRPALAATQLEFFPNATVEPRWNATKRDQVAQELNRLNTFSHNATGTAQAMAYYRALSNDGLRVLAGLPGNERAFTQLTIQPLDPNDPANANRLGPDNPPGFVVDPALRAYVDTLDGRSTNRYFYRAAYVDGAQNRGALSLASAPVWLPDIIPPAQPRLLKVLGGDRQVTVQWAANPDLSLQRYLVYRSESKEDSQDIRLMGSPVADLPARPIVATAGAVDLGSGTDIVTAERVYAAAGFNPTLDLLNGQTAAQYLAAPTAPSATRVTGVTAPNGTAVVVVYRDSRNGLQYTAWGTAPRVWTDQGLVGARNYTYRVVATRMAQTGSGTVVLSSPPSAAGSGRAVDLTPPNPPTWTRAEWIRVDASGTQYPFADPIPAGETRVPAIALAWAATEPDLTPLVQQRLDNQMVFTNTSGWLPPATTALVVPGLSPYIRYRFRLYVLSPAGNRNQAFNTIRVEPVIVI